MSEKKCFICKELEIYDNGKTCYSCDEDSYNIGKKQGAVEELERFILFYIKKIERVKGSEMNDL